MWPSGFSGAVYVVPCLSPSSRPTYSLVYVKNAPPPLSPLSLKWVYLVATYDGAIVRMYVNAELVAQVLDHHVCDCLLYALIIAAVRSPMSKGVVVCCSRVSSGANSV